MRNLDELNQWRDCSPAVVNIFGSAGNHKNGVFDIPIPGAQYMLRVMASVGMGWDHVSVSLPHRCPSWHEMEYVKRLFFKDNETAMQLHVPPDDHISFAETCLHLWRPINKPIPRPPAELVGAPMRKVG